MAPGTKETSVVNPALVQVFCLGRGTLSSRLEVPAEHGKPWLRLVQHESPETLGFPLSVLIGSTNCEFLLEAQFWKCQTTRQGKVP